MSRKRNISSIILEDEQNPSAMSARALKRRQRKPVNVLRRAIFSVIFALLGIAAMVAPLLTNYLEYEDYANALSGVEAAVASSEPDSLVEDLNSAYRYNEQFAAGRLVGTEEYMSLLDISGPIMGVLRVPKMEMALPIYHSTVPEQDVHGVCQIGPSGDSRGSSLPVGGPSTHAIISNVNSLPSSLQLSLIDALDSGDKLAISICGQEIAYEVYEAKMVGVSEASSADIEQGEDILTLVYAAQNDDESRFVVNAKRLVFAQKDALYLGSYDVRDFQKMVNIVFFNMSLPQLVIFIVGSAVMLFFVVRFMTSINDRVPKEMGRLSGDSG